MAHDKVPGICIGTDIIVGFPGETSEFFKGSCDTLQNGVLDYAHVFSYSERQFARSKKLADQVPVNDIKQRSEILRTISQRKKLLFINEQLGSKQTVLFEQYKDGYWIGLTDHYLKVYYKSASVKDLKNSVLSLDISDSYKDGALSS